MSILADPGTPKPNSEILISENLFGLYPDQLGEMQEIRKEEEDEGLRPSLNPSQLAAWLEWVRQPRMFADVVCSNWHDHIIEAAVYDPQTGKSVWGSGVDHCIECDAPVTVGRYFVTNEVELSERKP